MSTPRHRIVWNPAAQGSSASSKPLAERLMALEEDRASSGEMLVREASTLIQGELFATAEPWSWAAARALVTGELAALRAAHGWRGTVANWLLSLDELVGRGAEGRYTAPPRELVLEELGLWLGGEGATEGDWDGEPLTDGRRLPLREQAGAHFAGELEHGETVLVHGFSETVALALEEAQGRGLAPTIVVTEGGPDLGGRRLARRLVAAGARVRMVYDAALLAPVLAADRIVIGTEAIGARAFLGRVGTTALFAEAQRREVPTTVLTTSDKLMPDGLLELPTWCETAGWLLWEHAPEGVEVASQAYESVPFEFTDRLTTEHGPLGAAELAVRALRLGALSR
ncbi:MAG: hypothetical protein O2816_14450 [Planctomycetota bacterium]|nr:hypothetical protein [Planctomycetota bacterium]